jgi:hypothetical protein
MIYFVTSSVRAVDKNKSVYSIQSILGPRDIFPGYSIATLKPNAGRLLIQSTEDYGLPSSTPHEGEGRGSKKRPRSSEPENGSQGTVVVPTSQEEIKPTSELGKAPSTGIAGNKSLVSLSNQSSSNQNISPVEKDRDADATSLFCGSRAPFDRWDLHFEGLQNDLHDHSDCGVCGTSLGDTATFQCQTCSLVIHKTCLQHTTLKDQIRDAKSTQWACPICSLCSFCSKHPVNGIENLEPNYFTCVFCPVKEPLIMMERMKSGLFSHSLCRFIVNLEQSHLKRCSICGEEGSGLVRNPEPSHAIILMMIGEMWRGEL